MAGLLGLTGVVIGGLALARPAGRFGISSGPRGAIIALAAGLIGIALGGLVVAISDAGIGTGNGRAGAYVALVMGLTAVIGSVAHVKSVTSTVVQVRTAPRRQPGQQVRTSRTQGTQNIDRYHFFG